jgi:glycosyltransferase involved in cell wall biosynthesis
MQSRSRIDMSHREMSKIVHFGKYYFPDHGGIESVTRGLAEGASSIGHSVTVICFKRNASPDFAVIDGVRVVRAPTAVIVASQPLDLRYVWHCLRESRDADIVHLHTPNMLGGLCCLLLRKSIRLVVHWHSDVIGKPLLGRLFRPLENALLSRADRVIATSHAYMEGSQALRRVVAKTSVIPIGMRDPTIPRWREDHSSKLPEELRNAIDGLRLILSIGRLVPYKGFEYLIQAAKAFRNDAVLVIVGDGPLHASLRASIDEEGLEDRVFLAGRVGEEALHELFCRAEVFCLASISRAEAFGVVLVEAMAHGLPVVATAIPGSGVPWVNQHGVTGLNVPVRDPAALAMACNQILDSDQERARLSAGSRRRFDSEFLELAAVRKMNAVYERLLA